MSKTYKYLLLIIIINVFIVSFWVYQRYIKQEWLEYITFGATRGNIEETIKARWEVVSKKQYNLEFPSSWIVEKIYVKKWDIVKKWDVLMKLETIDNELELKAQKSLLLQRTINLEKLKKWAKIEDIKIYNTTLSNAEKNLINIKKIANEEIENSDSNIKNATIILNNAKISIKNTDKAIINANKNLKNIIENNKIQLINLNNQIILIAQNNLINIWIALSNIDNILDNENQYDNNFKNLLWTKNPSSLITANNLYRKTKNTLQDAKDIQKTIWDDKWQTKINSLVRETKETLGNTLQTLSAMKELLENSTTNNDFSASDLNILKNQIESNLININKEINSINSQEERIEEFKINSKINEDVARTNVDSAKSQKDTAKSNLDSANNSLRSAKQNRSLVDSKTKNQIEIWDWQIQIAKDQLKSIKSWNTIEDIKIASAQIQEIEARIEIIKERIKKSSLYSITNGKVSNIWIEEWELFKPQMDRSISAISLTSIWYKVQSDISETEVWNIINEGNYKVDIVLDAFPWITLTWNIISIEPQEVIRDWDRYYRTNISITNPNEQIRSWMSTDLIIKISTKENVIKIPSIAVYRKNDKFFTKILKGKDYIETEIKIWILDDEYAEVTSWISENDTIGISKD